MDGLVLLCAILRSSLYITLIPGMWAFASAQFTLMIHLCHSSHSRYPSNLRLYSPIHPLHLMLYATIRPPSSHLQTILSTKLHWIFKVYLYSAEVMFGVWWQAIGLWVTTYCACEIIIKFVDHMKLDWRLVGPHRVVLVSRTCWVIFLVPSVWIPPSLSSSFILNCRNTVMTNNKKRV